MPENSHLSEAWHRPDGFSVRLGPGDVGQRHSAGLADDLGSCSEDLVSLGATNNIFISDILPVVLLKST